MIVLILNIPSRPWAMVDMKSRAASADVSKMHEQPQIYQPVNYRVKSLDKDIFLIQELHG